jgi:signal transduction histidine kinase
MGTPPERSIAYTKSRIRAPSKAVAFPGFVAAYIFLDWLSYLHPLEPFRITPWNPQAAFAIALIMLYGKRCFPIVGATILAGDLLLRWSLDTLLVAVSGSLVLSLGYAAIAYGLRHPFPVRPQLDDRRDVMRLVAVVLVGALVTGTLYIGSRLAAGIGTLEEFPRALLSFWIGDSVGIIVTLPLLLMLSDQSRWRQWRTLLLHRESGAQAIATAGALWFIFGRDAARDFHYLYLLFLPLVWMAGRSGMVGAVLAVAVIQAGVILSLYLAPNRAFDVFELQGLLIALSVTGFFVGVTVDERLRAADELRQSLKLASVAEMAAAVAHELNQPLAALMGYAKAGQLLAQGGPDRHDEIIETMGKLSIEAKRAGDVVRRLREFFTTGETRTESISLEALLDAVLLSFAPRAALGNVSVVRRTEGVLQQIKADQLQIEVVLRNLLSNAFDAVGTMPPEQRQIAVELAGDARELRVRILDSGPGIALEGMEQLFEAFATTKAAGMGMGLPLSRAIVEAHGGRLWAVPGNGGEIWFVLPTSGPQHA